MPRPFSSLLHRNHAFGLLLAFALTSPAQTQTSSPGQPAPAKAPYLDPSLPVEQRVNDLVSRMTLEEKISQMRDHAAAIPRLGVPKYDWWNESLHGVAMVAH